MHGEGSGAIRAVRAEARVRVWKLVGAGAPDSGESVTVDLDGALVLGHSVKEDAAPTWKRTYGHHPLMRLVDHGPGGTRRRILRLARHWTWSYVITDAFERLALLPHPG